MFETSIHCYFSMKYLETGDIYVKGFVGSDKFHTRIPCLIHKFKGLGIYPQNINEYLSSFKFLGKRSRF